MNHATLLPIAHIALSLIIAFLAATSATATETTIVAEGQYVMADGDTLVMAEDKVLQRAQRKAIEEAGLYLEATSHDYEAVRNGTSTHVSSLEIRTLAAAITKTEILESRRSFERDRPVFMIRIRAIVNMEHLQEAIRRWRSEEQLTAHFKQLQRENAELKAQLRETHSAPSGVRTLMIQPPGRTQPQEQAHHLVESAVRSHSLRQKIDLTSQAATLDPQSAAPLIVRGQTYLKMVSLAYANKSRLSEYAEYIDYARMDFDRALLLDAGNSWALLGQGDVSTWLNQTDAAETAYTKALEIDPFFDIARQRLIRVMTAQARKLISMAQWNPAMTTLDRILNSSVSESWTPSQKEAYFLRGELHQQLNQPTQAIADLSIVIDIDPAHVQALLMRGTLYREQLEGRLAKEDFEQACLLGALTACEQLP
ncbi:MAG: Tetratricopeptide repeat protein [Nitrospira sp.]|nr:MAG: Tetratricopeptide repeat protein [Nitrospira sp.]